MPNNPDGEDILLLTSMSKPYLSCSSNTDYCSLQSDSEDERVIPDCIPYDPTLFARDVQLTEDNFYCIASNFKLHKKGHSRPFPVKEDSRATWTETEKMRALNSKYPETLEKFGEWVSILRKIGSGC